MSSPKLANRFVFWFLIYQMLSSIILNTLSLRDIFPSVLLQVLPIAFYFFLTKQSFFDVVYIKKISKKNLCLLILFAFMIQPVMIFFCELANLFFENPTQDIINNFLSKPLYELIFFVAACPAIVEEIIFRGIFFSGYKNINNKKAFFFNGLLFAIIHLNYNQFLYALIMGIVFCIINFYTGSILASILVHFIFNATQIIGAYLVINKHVDFDFYLWLSNLLGIKNNILVCGLVALVPAYICFLLIKKLISNCLQEKKSNPKFNFGFDDKDDNINIDSISPDTANLDGNNLVQSKIYQDKIFTWSLIFYLGLGFFLMTVVALYNPSK